MRKWLYLLCLAGLTSLLSFTAQRTSLRTIYSRPAATWPAPQVDAGTDWKELGVRPESPLLLTDSVKAMVELGKALFFDPRLSGSGKISCASCHQPEKHWTDGVARSFGHDSAVNKRNAPSVQNTWFYDHQFWDGRSRDLQDQAFGPINSETEMHSDMPDVIGKLRRSKGYRELFRRAYGDEGIDPDRMTGAIAVFERSVVSAKSRFDAFLEGDRRALSNSELRGLHLFRTKARCMNCHSGPLFTDNGFHNNGFHLNGNPLNDPGRFSVTRDSADIGKFKTPSLRDVAYTGPWMHNGMAGSLPELLRHYNKGADGNGGAEKTIKMLYLTNKELEDLQAFLGAISSPAPPFPRPILPE